MGDDGLHRELRIAAVMTGGVSLAVWMGGVASEMYRLVAALDDREADAAIYRQLLEDTKTEARLDVITGASAGGLNGALLATAWRRALPVKEFFRVRKVWLESGSIENLLRPVRTKNPPSLFKGDEYFTNAICEVLEDWARIPPIAPRAERPVHLTITVTTLTPEPVMLTDDFGEDLYEVDHRQRLVFQEEHFEDRWVRELALAARTSASLPFAFEPSFLPVGESVGGRPDLGAVGETAPIASFASHRWAIDGGMVVNLPIRPALERIFAQPASSQVRRVLVYVNPTPSGPPSAAADDAAEMPTIAKVVATGFQGAPWQQTIRDHLADIRVWNERIRRQRANRRDLPASRLFGGGEGTSSDGRRLLGLAEDLFPQYRHVRAARSVDTTVSYMAEVAGVDANDPAVEAVYRAALESARKEWLPERFDVSASAGTYQWRWGIEPIEYAISAALDLLVRALDLPYDPDAMAQRDATTAAKEELHRIRSRVELVRSVDRAYWTELHQQLRETITAGGDLSQWAEDAYGGWPMVSSPDAQRAARAFWAEFDPSSDAVRVTEDDALRALVLCANQLAVAVVHAAPAVAGALGASSWEELADLTQEPAPAEPTDRDGGHLMPSRAEAQATRKRDLADRLLLVVPTPPEDPNTGQGCLKRLMALHVVQTVLDGRPMSNEQPVELLQVSWNAQDTVTRRRPEDKVTGTELFRLGAFAKSSWRANDWMWGRMDGAARLVPLLIEPERLAQLKMSAADAVTMVERAATTVGAVGKPEDTATLEAAWRDRRNAVAEELSYLDDDTKPMPRRLDASVAAVTYALQIGILQDELPQVHDEVEGIVLAGGWEADLGRFRVAYNKEMERTGRREPSAEAAPALLDKCEVGKERFGVDELLSEPMVPTMAQTAAVGFAAIEGQYLGLGFFGGLIRKLRLRWIALAFWGGLRAVGLSSRPAVFVVSLVLGAALAVLGLWAVADPPGVVVLAAILTVVAIGAAAAIRVRWGRAGKRREAALRRSD